MHTKTADLNFQLLGSIPDGIWCIQKQRSSIFSFSDPFRTGSGAFKCFSFQFSASRIHFGWDLVHSKATILNSQLLGSNPDRIGCILKQRFSIYSFSDPFQMGYGAFTSSGLQFSACRTPSIWDLAHSKATVCKFHPLRSIPNEIWCIQKHRSSIISSSDSPQMGPGAFNSSGP